MNDLLSIIRKRDRPIQYVIGPFKPAAHAITNTIAKQFQIPMVSFSSPWKNLWGKVRYIFYSGDRTNIFPGQF